MGQRVIRTALVAGGAVLALLLVLAMCGGGKNGENGENKDGAGKGDGPAGGTASASPGPEATPTLPRLATPTAYDAKRGWRITGGSAEYAVSQEPALIAHVERSGTDRFVLRAHDARTGKRTWSGRPWRPLSDPAHFPRLLALQDGDHRFFITWSYGKVSGPDALSTGDSVVSLDIYDVKDGMQRHVDLPWAGVPVVSATGPDILVTDGAATSATVDPLTGRATPVAPKDLGYPKGCANCRSKTEVRGLTPKGLLVSGRTEFWVRGAWHSAAFAPRGTAPASGVPTSLTPSGHVLAKWQPKKPDGSDLWAVHDAATGKVLATAACRKPAIEPGAYPRAVTSPSGDYLVAGNLAFDLRTPVPQGATTGHCFEEREGVKPVTLTSVTNEGIAYGTTSTTSASGTPVEVPLATAAPAALPDTAVLPEAEVANIGLFRTTDRQDRPQLIGYLHR
ncbi:hypothetical protein OG897_08965 [Streptomyces sp. NBC_00237]|uniref:hypothetical protein n=1 Tax=Streptomyces sp. NBC_00237 TaxID=2975687 RepID=UPI002258B118|nr:hypothetical protein [Streptomyces sp. NBC_00237]MCX5201578.1 hypothetical protein [Streptomyces sp. NBC_00237]